MSDEAKIRILTRQRDSAVRMLLAIRRAYIRCAETKGEEYTAARLALFEQIAKIPEAIPASVELSKTAI